MILTDTIQTGHVESILIPPNADDWSHDSTVGTSKYLNVFENVEVRILFHERHV